jgi:adhesin transport system outer membrane protein
MNYLSLVKNLALVTSLFSLCACQSLELAQNTLNSIAAPNVVDKKPAVTSSKAKNRLGDNSSPITLSLKEAILQSAPEKRAETDFAQAIAAAVYSDPKVKLGRAEVNSRRAGLGLTKTQLDFQFSGTIYAGIEDVTDETNGMAAVLSASRVMYDGGQISNSISAEEFSVNSALESYNMLLNERALEVSIAWVEYERYQSLNKLMKGRLAVLDPLIGQLERVADAGVGDATQVAAAQRTVSMIRVTETDIEERMAQSNLKLVRVLGSLPRKVTFDATAVAASVPQKVTESLAMSAPGLLAAYSSYLASLENLKVARARDSFTVGFETKVQKPFGNSGYESDESIGIVVRKNLNGKERLKSEVLNATAAVDYQEAKVQDVYRTGKQSIEAGIQTITSMDKAIEMARSNTRSLKEEIVLLKKQLVIGQSTLDSVLSGEARLYDAESKEIHFIADKRTAQLSVLSTLGLLRSLFDIKS